LEVFNEGLLTPNAAVTRSTTSTQPRGKGARFWRDAVAKMVTVYKAPPSPEDADAIATTLARKFG